VGKEERTVSIQATSDTPGSAAEALLRILSKRELLEDESSFCEFLFAVCPSLILILEGDRISRISNSCRFLGYSPEEMKGTCWQDYVEPEDLQRTDKENTGLRTKLISFEFRNRWRCKDGKIVGLKWSALLVRARVIALAEIES